MNKTLTILILFFVFFTQSCKQPTSTEFIRSNPFDPDLESFVLPPPQTPDFELFFDKSVLLTWEDTTNFTDGYILEKSLDGINFFLLDTLEYPDSEYLDESREVTSMTRYSLKSFRRIETGLNISNPISFGVDFGEMVLDTSFYSATESELNLSWEFTSGWPFIVEVVLFSGFDGVDFLDTLRNRETTYSYSFEQDFKERFLEARAYIFEEDLENSDDDSYSSRVGAEYYTMEYLPEPIRIEVINEFEVQITWSDNSDFEDGFEVSRKKSNFVQAGGFNIIARLPANSSSFKDTQSPFSGVSCIDGFKEIRYGVRVIKGDTGTGILGLSAYLNC
ncbi:MAG: hypothetical protein ACMZ7B_03885 [Balneola sp.]